MRDMEKVIFKGYAEFVAYVIVILVQDLIWRYVKSSTSNNAFLLYFQFNIFNILPPVTFPRLSR